MRSVLHCDVMKIPSPKFSASSQGFTIVEIIVVILLVSLLSTVAMSRFIGGNTFNAAILRDQIISLSRIALQSSLGRKDVTLTITPNPGGSEVTITVADINGTIESSTISLDSLTSFSGDINQTASCAVTPAAGVITNVTPMTIAFGSLGQLEDSGVTGNVAAITSGLRLCINNEVNNSICMSPSGYAYKGDCDV